MSGIIDGGQLAFRALAFGRPSQRKIEFLRRQFEDPSRAMRYADSSFAERSQRLFESNFSDEVMEQYDQVLENHSRMWQGDVIVPFQTLSDFQNAKPEMQRWVMANPRLRTLYRQGRIEGYTDSYFDHSPKIDPLKHHDYRMVMSGLEQEDEDGTFFTTYFDEALPDDVPLTFTQKRKIRDITWRTANELLDEGTKDPTSVSGSDWG